MTEERGQIVGRGEFFHYFRSTDCLQFFPLLCTWHCAYICTWHWTSFIFFAFFPFVTLLFALHIFSFLSNSLHFALCCSLLCTYRPFHAPTTFLTTLLLPSILWRLHQSCLFSPFSLLPRVYKKCKIRSHPKVESCHLQGFREMIREMKTRYKARKTLIWWDFKCCKPEISENSRSREFSTRVSFIFSRSTTRNDFLKSRSRLETWE